MTDWLNKVYILIIGDLTEFFRIRMVTFSTLLTPVVMLFSFSLGMGQAELTVKGIPLGIPYVDYVVPGIIALGTMFSCSFTLGYTIISDRQRRLIGDIVLSPVSYSSFVIARILAGLVKCAAQFIASIIIVLLLLRTPVNHPFLLLCAYILTAVFFGALGMFFGAFSNSLTFPGFVNIVHMPFMYFCGVFFPINNFRGLAALLQFMPFTACIEMFRYAIYGKSLVFNYGQNLLLLFFYCFIMVSLAIWVFKKSVIRT